jgi:hypothetical protein
MLGVPAIAQWHPITTLDAPGAGAIAGYGTEGIAMNPAGVVTGFYVGYDNVVHSFVWTPDPRFTPSDKSREPAIGSPVRSGGHDGTFVTFDGPNVPSSIPDDPFSPPGTWLNTDAPGTYATAIDGMGAVTGYYVDANYLAHGFVRAPDGAFTSFEVPNAGTGNGQGTFSTNMNLQGMIAGYYVDAAYGSHAFVLTLDGHITEFDAPGGVGSTSLGWAQCISNKGAVTGTYADSNGVTYGFVRDPQGNITTFEVKAKGLTSGQGTNGWGINSAGTVVGVFVDVNNIDHGLVRTADGKITVFDVPLAVGNTVAESIDEGGNVVGFYNDANGVHHGFLRSPGGEFTYFDVLGEGSEFHQGTVPMLINWWGGAITGFYEDSNYVWHGFVRK